MVQLKSLSIHINILINIYISIYIYIYINIYIRFCGGSSLVTRWLLFGKPVVITWLTIGYCLVNQWLQPRQNHRPIGCHAVLLIVSHLKRQRGWDKNLIHKPKTNFVPASISKLAIYYYTCLQMIS